jgi:hypothetical protein
MNVASIVVEKGEEMEISGGDLGVFLEIVNAVGVVGLLGFMVMAFYRGDLIARSLLDRILAVYEKQLAELSERILRRLEEALLKEKG